jgi:hypothetical protein
MLTDGDTVYLGGYENEDIMKPGLFEISASGRGPLTRIDERHFYGEGLLYGDRMVLAGPGRIEVHPDLSKGIPRSGFTVFTGPRHAKSVDLTACIEGRYSTQAYAVAGKTLLVAIFRETDEKTGIIRIPLP